MGEFVSLRVSKSLMGKLHRLKARLMFSRERKVSDAEVVREAVEFTLRKESEFIGGGKIDLMDYSGFIKGGKPSNAAVDVDNVLYGD